MSIDTPPHDRPRAVPARADSSTARLLAGAVAGPLFLAVGFAQALTREGFDLTVHPFSFLAIGEHGWIQTLNFLACGLLFVIGATGLARVTAAVGGPGHRWGPRLFGAMGLGCIAGGLFEADPAYGFPVGVGAPEGMAETLSWHGLLHGPAFGLAVIGWVGSALCFARWYAARGRRGAAAYAASTAVLLLAGGPFMMSGTVIALYVTATYGWIWTTVLCLDVRGATPSSEGRPR